MTQWSQQVPSRKWFQKRQVFQEVCAAGHAASHQRKCELQAVSRRYKGDRNPGQQDPKLVNVSIHPSMLWERKEDHV